VEQVGRRIEIRGAVQGVGFRPWVLRVAREAGVTGRVLNDPQGVTIEAFGPAPAVEGFLHRLESAPPAAARIEGLQAREIPARDLRRFRIARSHVEGGKRLSVPADLATCVECAREIASPEDRRYGYPFTNCTDCGPRFTILRQVPYDRAGTSMAAFTMCRACAKEYRSPGNRRFHAQPNACPKCGPRLRAVSPLGETLPTLDPVGAAVAYLEAGLIVCLKGIGGFHLACDATSPAAVRRLRERKRRDQKPFAVMARDLDAARRLGHVREEEAALLTSVERPIVLVRRRFDSGLAWEVAPANPLVGVLLPYSPLHHLLLSQGPGPLVMTSGNLADEPIARTDGEALGRLKDVADVFLVHEREIVARCDDSVARVVAGRPMLLRRSRGYVPRPLAVARPFDRPVLACGGHLKNAFCIGVGDAAYMGPHIGDLDALETVRAFEEAVAHMERLLGVEPEVVAHDLHPWYLSTAYALRRPAAVRVAVQHHHAHVASALAEHRLAGRVIGVAYDGGTGYGTDGTSWGGEVMVADADGFDRVATFRALALPGSEVAIHEVWRLALALLEDAYDGAPPLESFSLFRLVSEADVSAVRKAARIDGLWPMARGVGRYFDALGALILGRPRSHFDGQVALEWNLAADTRERGRYPFEVDRATTPWTIDLRGMVQAAVADLRSGLGPATISGRFHNTLAAVTAAVVRSAAELHGGLPVVLTGGCFQNALLAERLLEDLSPDLRVFLHRQVPPGDGGLALGQALVADARARRSLNDRACA
jgi:hydrogenase maturation protein HypF